MSMTKREIAIASVNNTIKGWNTQPGAILAADDIIDQLITDGLLSLGYAGDPDVSAVVDQFQMAFRTTATIRTDRFAASRLAKRHGQATVAHVIQTLAARRNEKFAPTVNNLTQLEQKWPTVERFVGTPTRGDGLDV